MLKIRRMGAFKPWGSAVSAIEIALWDIAGQAAGVPVYKLLGGKIRDRVRAYNGGVRFPMTGQTPQHYAENIQAPTARNGGAAFARRSARASRCRSAAPSSTREEEASERAIHGAHRQMNASNSTPGTSRRHQQ